MLQLTLYHQSKEKEMQGKGNNDLNIFLLGAIFNILAGIDFNSLIDYSLKAFVGGVIWLGFKILADYMSRKSKKESDGDR
jgi:hypothetical protein